MTPEEVIKAARARANAARVEREREGAAEIKAGEKPSAKDFYRDPRVRGAAAQHVAESGIGQSREEAENAPPRREGEVPHVLPGFQGFTEDLQRTLASEATRGLSERATAGMSGRSLEEEQAEAAAARARTGAAGDIAATVGMAAPYAALPQSGFANAAKSLITGGLAGGADTTIASLAQKGDLPEAVDLGVSIATAGLGSAAGYLVGKGLASRWDRYKGPKATIVDDTVKSIETIEKQVKAAAQQMDNSGVTFRSRSVRNLANKIEKSIMNDRSLMPHYVSKTRSPLARQALEELRDLDRNGINPSFSVLNNIRQGIRDSTRNANFEVVAGVHDARLINHIDDRIREYMESIGSMHSQARQAHLSNEGNISAALGGFKTMNENVQKQVRADMISGLMENAHQAEIGGTSYDQALQRQVMSFIKRNKDGKMHPRVTRNFTKDEINWLRKIAEGSDISQMLNRLDRSFGHGLLGDLHRTYAIATRKVPAAGARGTARELFEGVTGTALPGAGAGVPASVGMGGRAGAAAGQEVGGDLLNKVMGGGQ